MMPIKKTYNNNDYSYNKSQWKGKGFWEGDQN